jgi:hypothetical protein
VYPPPVLGWRALLGTHSLAHGTWFVPVVGNPEGGVGI